MKNLLTLLGLVPFITLAQSSAIEYTLTSGSGFNKNELLQANWAIGEIFTETFKHNGGTVTTGINNNNVIYIITNIDSYEVAKNIEVFPIPFTDELTIQSHRRQINWIRISDLNGKEVFSKNITRSEDKTKIDTSQLSPNLYLLTVQEGSLPIVLKIIKK